MHSSIAVKAVVKPLMDACGGVKTYLGSQRRDSRYVLVAIAAALILVLATIQAFSQGLFDSVERPIFQAVNGLPAYIGPLMFILTQFGGLGSLILWVAAAWFLINRRGAFTVVGAGFTAWLAAKFLKDWVARGRPSALLDTVHLFGGEHFGGFGFPSGHSTFSAACATVLYYQADRKYRKWLLLIVFLVGFSRMYLGAHFPLDVVGGWALGALIGSLACIIFGVSTKGITAARLKQILQTKGFRVQSLKFADVDARGSRPLFLTDDGGHEYFAKIFGASEHASDWLFKFYRFFRYKNLQGEEPYLSGRRNIELESFATMWARQGRVRVPAIINIVQIGSPWMLIQEKLDAKPLANGGHIAAKTLEDVWKQVKRLHGANMAHRDLRAANVMVDKKGQAWLIDFGFAEVAPKKQRQHMDIAELLMSMSLVVGVKRTVEAACSVLSRTQLVAAMPYLVREVFSGATAKGLKENKGLLKELKTTLSDRLDIKKEIDDADIVRINFKTLINVGLIGVFLYIIVPQFSQFRGSLHTLGSLNAAWLPVVALASVATYLLTAVVYMVLSSVPLGLWATTLVQLAASFMSKIVPGGFGSTGLNARFLKKAGLDSSDTAALLTGQGAIGFIMFIIPLLLFLLLNGQNITSLLKFHVTAREIYGAVAVIIIAAAVMRLFKKLRKKVLQFAANFIGSIRAFAGAPREVAWAAVASMSVTLAYIVCLYASMQAFNLHPGISTAVLVYASAVVAKAVIPTPGGLGPLEIAMVSSMVGLGIAKPEAISIVVLYRLATFWLPIPFSVWAYRYVTKQKLV